MFLFAMVTDIQLLAGVDDWHHTYVMYYFSHVVCAGVFSFWLGARTLNLPWFVLSTVARPSAFGRGTGSAEFLKWCLCTCTCFDKFAALCVGMFRGFFSFAHIQFQYLLFPVMPLLDY